MTRDPRKTAPAAPGSASDGEDTAETREYAPSRWERPLPPVGTFRRGPRKGLHSRGRRKAPVRREDAPVSSPSRQRYRITPIGPRLRRRDVIQITPEAFIPQGFAVTRAGKRQVAVWAGIPGEAVQAGVDHIGQNRIRTRFLQPVGEPHPHRREPPCERFTTCGSCPLMHLTPEGQRDARLDILHGHLRDAGISVHAPAELIHLPDGAENYRHVAKLAVDRSDHGRLRVGAIRRGSNHVVAIPDCLVITPGLRAAMRITARAIIDMELGPWSPADDDGPMRHVVLRQSRSTGEILATIVAGWHARNFRELARRMTSAEANIAGVHLHLNNRPGNAIFDHGPDGEAPGFLKLAGARSITDELDDLRYEIGPGDFFQANPAMSAKMVADAVAWLEPWRDRPVLDLYCGVGAFTLPLARAHGFALGIEGVGGAVQRAEDNARRNRVPAEFAAGDVGEVLAARREKLVGRGAVVVADPARRGLEPGVVDTVLALEPAAFLLVSCNPAAFARDLQRFIERDWRVVETAAYDLFPQTVHLEAMALLEPPVAPSPSVRSPRRKVVR